MPFRRKTASFPHPTYLEHVRGRRGVENGVEIGCPSISFAARG